MGKRRGGRSSRRSADETNDATSDADSYLDVPHDQNSLIENQILDARHPFELNNFIESKVVTPSQRAITCCIQLNNGWASEDTLLTFLQTNWGFIGKLNTKLPNNMPDTRILHINLVVKKKGIPLFIQKNDDPSMWTVNSSTERGAFMTQASLISDDEKKSLEKVEPESFEDCVLSELKKFPQGISLDELVRETVPFENKNGLFKALEHPRRVKAVLVSKKNENIIFEKNGFWSMQNHVIASTKGRQFSQDSILPPQLKNIRVSELSVGQFFSLLKESKVY